MAVERISPSGGWEVSDIVDGYLIRQRYFGYTKRQAIALFRKHLKATRKQG